MVKLLKFLFGSRASDRIVPPRGNSAWLTFLAAVAMAFIAVFALALALAVQRVADRWALDLAQTATVTIVAPSDELAGQTQAALTILTTTPGVEKAEILDDAAQAALLEPWLGADLPIDRLPLPRLIEVTITGDGPDLENLKLRFAAEAPGAKFDDHRGWRQPLRNASAQLRLLAFVSMALVVATTAIIVTLAANAALSANESIVKTLRLIGATDAYIARAFVRRVTFRTLAGAIVGAGLAVLLMIPYQSDQSGTLLNALSFQGLHWLYPLMVPIMAAITAFLATRIAAARHLHRAA